MAEKAAAKLPRVVETRDLGLVYDGSNNTWAYGYQSVFRPNPDAAAINISSSGKHTIIDGVEGRGIRIISICFTVADEVDVILYDGAIAISGPMDFGGASEPRGIVIPYSYAPLGLHSGNSFIINLSDAVQVSGLVCYFYQ